jgi:hypothetical protein
LLFSWPASSPCTMLMWYVSVFSFFSNSIQGSASIIILHRQSCSRILPRLLWTPLHSARFNAANPSVTRSCRHLACFPAHSGFWPGLDLSR